MRYYEIRTENRTIDVVTNREDRFVCNVTNVGILRGKKMEEAHGVISSDGQYVWQIHGREELPGERITVELREILTVEEYEDLKSRLDEIGSIEEPKDTEPENPQETVMTPVEMRMKIMELTSTVNDLTERKDA